MKSTIDIFVQLGDRLSAGVPESVAIRAYNENKWLTASDIERAVEAIREKMLTREALTQWLDNYPTLPTTSPERVLIIMAGNIPLVGFFDLLCVIAAGEIALIKPSHKDRVLTEWIVDLLREIEPDIPMLYYDSTLPDRVIATGGDLATQHFKQSYGSLPTLIRGSRHSIAVISDECEGLERDIYYYSGLGCRNVSMIFVPERYDLTKIPTPENLNAKYRNNLRQNRAMLRMNNIEHFDNGCSCFIYQNCFPQQISTISIVEYNSLAEVQQWISTNDDELQCIVANADTIDHPRRVAFGEAQYPTLSDYADGVDTMCFLS